MTAPNRRTYQELLSNEPAWPGLEAIARASGRVVVLPREAPAAEACLERLQVTTRSALGALAYETGGLLIDAGWLRLFGAGSARLTRALGAWNDALGIDVADLLVFGDDVVGGLFAINGGALGPARGNVFYFAPDTLAWEDLGRGHGAFVEWAMTGDLAMFYKHPHPCSPFPHRLRRFRADEHRLARLGTGVCRPHRRPGAEPLPAAVVPGGEGRRPRFATTGFGAGTLAGAARDGAAAWDRGV